MDNLYLLIPNNNDNLVFGHQFLKLNLWFYAKHPEI